MSQLQRINVESIDSPIQTRPYSETHAKGLMASIKAEGLHTPIKVFQKADRYILGPGMHRLMAVRMLGYTDIDAVVETYESDEQVRSAQRAENILRENMTPMQEALAIEQAMNDNGGSQQMVANSLGRPMAWVQARLALLALTADSRQALDEGRITLRHAQLLAKVADADRQNNLLGACASEGRPGMHVGRSGKGPNEYVPLMSTEDLADRVATIQRDLADVDWRLEDRFGKNNRDCATCPHNSKNRPELFLDQKLTGMVCGDAPCFDDKKVLARLGARRTAFTLVKSGHAKPSEAQVTEAATGRDAAFVTFAAVKTALKSVVEMKTEKKGGNGKDPKAASSSRALATEAESENIRKVNSALREEAKAWKEKALEAVAVAIEKAPLAPAYLLLLSCTQEWDQAENNKLPQKGRPEFLSLLAGALKADGNALARVGRVLVLAKRLPMDGTRLGDVLSSAAHDIELWNEQSNQLIGLMLEAFKINTEKLGAKPTFNSIKAKLFPKIEKKEENTKPASKGKKKAA